MEIESSLISAFDRGVYDVTDGLKLINFKPTELTSRERRVSRRTIARWMRGYTYDLKGENHYSPPLWKPDYPGESDTDGIELSFRDLIEIRFVKAFRDIGLGMPAIRKCFERAVEALNDERPFSTQKFRTDGKTIFLEITEGINERHLEDLKHRQVVFRDFVAPSLKDLEFDSESVARWYPLGANRAVVVDPKYSFGRPTVRRIPTEMVADAVRVEGSSERVAELYDLTRNDIDAALEFERLAA